jgi:hypothetical protein
MVHRLRRLDPLQTGKVLGALYALMGLVFLPVFWLVGKMMPAGSGGGLFTGLGIMMPIVYGLFGLIFGAIGAAIYNLIAGWTGGLEMELDTME